MAKDKVGNIECTKCKTIHEILYSDCKFKKVLEIEGKIGTWTCSCGNKVSVPDWQPTETCEDVIG